MNRFDRQTLIEGWKQESLEQATVVVCGKGWPGCFAVWALRSLGVGTLLWLGRMDPTAAFMADWLVRTPREDGAEILDFSCDAETGFELETILEMGTRSRILACCADDVAVHQTCHGVAQRAGVRYLAVHGNDWLGSGLPISAQPSPVTAVHGMILGAILADAVRETICPILDQLIPPQGQLCLPEVQPQPGKALVLIGAGGIGVYAATLAAFLEFKLEVLDMDFVEESNLNRQGLFSLTDVRGRASKAEAVASALRTLLPRSQINGQLIEVSVKTRNSIAAFQPSMLLSAVDNAATRLCLQELGRQSEIPVIQGGTDVFAADCFTQVPGGTLLDDQMFGALSSSEAQGKPPNQCSVHPSYVIPGMVCAAQMVHRAMLLSHATRPLPPLRWRSGSLPIER